jgi:hypothetical protein
MLKSRKHVFWEALIITIFIFLIGFLFGIYMERSNYNKLNDYSTLSEIRLIDGMALIELSKDEYISCGSLKRRNVEFADNVYREAKLLDKYEESGRLTESIKILHKKYDMLRALAWISNSNSYERCKNYNLIVYLYEYDSEEINTKAVQSVWSKKLVDFKNNNPESVLLPIAANQDISSVDVLLDKYNITALPAIVINNEKVIYEYSEFDSYFSNKK